MNPIRKIAIGVGLVASSAAGGMFGAALLSGTSSAQEATTSTVAAAPSPAASSAYPDRPPFDADMGGHVGANEMKEALLTGDIADKVKAAALGAVPGGTVDRVENDAEGSPYEAHMTKPDGSRVTVKVDAGFKATKVETCPNHH